MTTRTWNGSSDLYANAADWSPNGVPVAGDVAVINSGTVTATGTDLAANLVVQVNSTAAITAFNLVNATVPASDRITGVSAANALFIGVNGSVTNQGVIVLAQNGATNSRISVTDQSGGGASTLVNSGVIDAFNTISVLENDGSNGANSIVNNGLIAMYGTGATTYLLASNLSISGTGNIQIGPGFTFQTSGALGSGQTVLMQAVNGIGSTLGIENLPSNRAVIQNFTASDKIQLTSVQYTSVNASTANGISTLTFSTNGTVLGSVYFAGTYGASNLSVNNSVDASSGLEVTNITTTVPDPTASAFASTSLTTGPVYRFFDRVFGTHLFTQDPNEVRSILSTRPDLTQEVNGFGSVAASDPVAEPVYRFFSTVNGTHFFTANFQEFQGLTTPNAPTYRPDLTWESGSTFYEDSVQLVGDVPVYRFFDTVHGTQFLTGDATEIATITTQNTPGFRPDLTNEGVAFYAPSGSFYTT